LIWGLLALGYITGVFTSGAILGYFAGRSTRCVDRDLLVLASWFWPLAPVILLYRLSTGLFCAVHYAVSWFFYAGTEAMERKRERRNDST
jgi:fructose-specific phosphotransferase system IIC component